jgi:hypothetical protein
MYLVAVEGRCKPHREEGLLTALAMVLPAAGLTVQAQMVVAAQLAAVQEHSLVVARAVPAVPLAEMEDTALEVAAVLQMTSPQVVAAVTKVDVPTVEEIQV